MRALCATVFPAVGCTLDVSDAVTGVSIRTGWNPNYQAFAFQLLCERELVPWRAFRQLGIWNRIANSDSDSRGAVEG